MKQEFWMIFFLAAKNIVHVIEQITEEQENDLEGNSDKFISVGGGDTTKIIDRIICKPSTSTSRNQASSLSLDQSSSVTTLQTSSSSQPLPFSAESLAIPASKNVIVGRMNLKNHYGNDDGSPESRTPQSPLSADDSHSSRGKSPPNVHFASSDGDEFRTLTKLPYPLSTVPTGFKNRNGNAFIIVCFSQNLKIFNA